MPLDIMNMKREELLRLDPENVDRLLTPLEVVYIAWTLGAFWKYDYEAARQGKVGMHAVLKSERHSNGFFISKVLLEPRNILNIMARQIVMRLDEAKVPVPDFVGGIPNGATKLGDVVSSLLNAFPAQLDKVEGRIQLTTPFQGGESLLLIEDFCTRGTGFKEAVKAVLENCPSSKILPFDPVILNRGGLKAIDVPGVGAFTVLPVVEWRIEDWDPTEGCPLCRMGSTPIKPKETEANWQAITTSQL